MRATIKNYLEGAKAQREENGEKGFSLIELIIVIVILGILVAIAIPVFAGLQDTAKKNALDTVAANGATAVAAQIAANTSGGISSELAKLATSDITVVNVSASGGKVSDVCVAAVTSGAAAAPSHGASGTATSLTTAYAGPGCL